MFRIVDKRHNDPIRLSLGHLKTNDTFEWSQENRGEAGLDHSAPHRVLHQNSNYLGSNNRHASCRMYVLNILTGKIHHRNVNTPVVRIDVQMCIFNHGELKR